MWLPNRQAQQRANKRVEIGRGKLRLCRVARFSKGAPGERHAFHPALFRVVLQNLAEIWKGRMARTIFGTVFFSNFATAGWIRVQTGFTTQFGRRVEWTVAADAVAETACSGRFPADALLQEARVQVLPLHV